MTWHDATVIGYLIVLTCAAGLDLASRRDGSRIPSLADLLSRLMRTRPGRIGLLAGWAWVGLHFFAK